MRQNSTNESLKRIDEIEEETRRLEIRAGREKEFAKVVDNFARDQKPEGPALGGRNRNDSRKDHLGIGAQCGDTPQ